MAPLIKKPEFVELLARTNFSFLMGASQPEEMVLRAKANGYKGIGICDINGLYGVVRGYQAAKKPSHFEQNRLAPDFRYHIGAELTPYDTSPICLMPTTKDGYQTLSEIITTAKKNAKKDSQKNYVKLSLRDIIKKAGLATGELLGVPLPPWNPKTMGLLCDAFGPRLYLPVYRDMTWESLEFTRQAFFFEKEFSASGLRLFATNRPLFHSPERKKLHDVLTCVRLGITIDQAKTKLTLNSERYLKPLAELASIFQDRPDLLEETLKISDRLQFQLSELHYKYPREALPKNFPKTKSSSDYLRTLVEARFDSRYKSAIRGITNNTAKSTPLAHIQRARAQVEHELSLIKELEYEDYFLTLYDICQFASSKNILHQGRGSAANSIVCYILGLTAIDPIKLGLLFERFLSRERAEPPDIDIDFEHERREEVIQYIYQKYGHNHAAMVTTVIRYRSRMALRDVAKVMGVTPEKADLLVKTMGKDGLDHFLEKPFPSEKYGISKSRFQKILALARELKGTPRHLGIHTGGFVISRELITDLVPVEPATMVDRTVIQWNKDDIAVLKFMKIDILSLGMLSALKKAFELLKEKKSIELSLSTIPHDDQATYQMIQAADTMGVFQIESRAQSSLLPRLLPKTWYDLVIQIALVRPGPIQGGLVHPYLKRRQKKEPITYAHPDLKPVLEKTLGVPIFQEQVMRIAVSVAGFTPGEADELRRMVSSAWRKKVTMEGLRQRLVGGMLQKGISSAYANHIYKVIEGFSEYGFPESHAASFALITYASSYIKKHHPDIFVVSLLNSQPMGFYPTRLLIDDARKHGVRFRDVCVQHSDWSYTIEPSGHVRVGLSSIKGLAKKDVLRLIQFRESLAPHGSRGGTGASVGTGARPDRSRTFQSLEEFIQLTGLSKQTVILLARAGALSHFSEPDTAQASTAQAGAAQADSSPKDIRKLVFKIHGLDFDQGSLFYANLPHANLSHTNLPQAAIVAADKPALRQETASDLIQREYQIKGFSLSHHPIAELRRAQANAQAREQAHARVRTHSSVDEFPTSKDLKHMKNGTRVKMIGLCSLLQRPPTANGVCFLSLEDEDGIFNAIIMPDLYKKVSSLIYASGAENNILEVSGVLQNIQNVIHIKASGLNAYSPSPIS